MMRFAALGAVTLLAASDRGQTQSATDDGWVLFAPNSARRVTLRRNGVLLGSLTIAKGTALVAFYDQRQPTSFASGRWEFRGDFRLHAQPANEMSPPNVPGGRVEQVRSEAPLLLSAQGVDVLMENVEQ
jgi:hypothetical protein